jgi:hypothetical protein
VIQKEETLIIVSQEFISAAAWAKRHNLQLDWIPDKLELHVPLTQAETGLEFYLAAKFPDYKELPPFWNFCSGDWTPSDEKMCFPRPIAPLNGTIASVFHLQNPNKAVICAPFNRLAFAEHEGPHTDWGGSAKWQACAPQHVRATTIGDMLNVIWMHFQVTKGRMSDAR